MEVGTDDGRNIVDALPERRRGHGIGQHWSARQLRWLRATNSASSPRPMRRLYSETTPMTSVNHLLRKPVSSTCFRQKRAPFRAFSSTPRFRTASVLRSHTLVSNPTQRVSAKSRTNEDVERVESQPPRSQGTGSLLLSRSLGHARPSTRRHAVRLRVPTGAQRSGEQELITEHTFADPEYARRRRKVANGRVRGSFTLNDLDDLMGYVAAEANHLKDKKLQRELDALQDSLNRRTGPSTTAPPPPPPPPRRRGVRSRNPSDDLSIQWFATSAWASSLATWSSRSAVSRTATRSRSAA